MIVKTSGVTLRREAVGEVPTGLFGSEVGPVRTTGLSGREFRPERVEFDVWRHEEEGATRWDVVVRGTVILTSGEVGVRDAQRSYRSHEAAAMPAWLREWVDAQVAAFESAVGA